MKKNLITGILIVCAVLVAGVATAEKISVGVAEFKNNATGVYWWNHGVGWELSSMLTNELAATNAFTVVERSKLEHVLREQDLADYGRVRPGTGAKIGQLTGAKYLVLGTVTAFEDKSKGTKGGVAYKGIRLGGKKKEAYIAIDLRVVDTTTGEIEFVRTVEARSSGRGFDVGLARGGFAGSLGQEKDTPVGKAIRAMVVEVTDYLECAMVTQGSCMSEFDAKEEKRRSGLKDTIKLD